MSIITSLILKFINFEKILLIKFINIIFICLFLSIFIFFSIHYSLLVNKQFEKMLKRYSDETLISNFHNISLISPKLIKKTDNYSEWLELYKYKDHTCRINPFKYFLMTGNIAKLNNPVKGCSYPGLNY